MWRRAALLAVVLSGGCELLVSNETRRVDAGPDAVSASCLTQGQGCVECDPLPAAACPATKPDAGPETAPTPDAGVDQGAVDAGGPDSGPDGGGVDAPGSGSGAAGAAGGCAPGDDCDGLPRERDPWPEACNAVLFSDGFLEAPAEETWGRSYGDRHIGVRSCGTLEWTAPAHHTLWAWLQDETVKGLPAGVLAELRLFPKWRGRWTLTLATNVRAQDDMKAYETRGCFCSLSFDEDGGLSLSVRDKLGGSTGHVAGFTLTGGSPVMQLWPDVQTDEIVCRLVPATGKPVEARAPRGSKEPGTVKIILSNTDYAAPYVWLWLDYLRIFAAGSNP